jgi:hypothetical protein
LICKGFQKRLPISGRVINITAVFGRGFYNEDR